MAKVEGVVLRPRALWAPRVAEPAKPVAAPLPAPAKRPSAPGRTPPDSGKCGQNTARVAGKATQEAKKQLRATLKGLCMSQARFAELSGEALRTVEEWAGKNETPPRPSALALVRIFREFPEVRARFEAEHPCPTKVIKRKNGQPV